jgi:hypothetical protein
MGIAQKDWHWGERPQLNGFKRFAVSPSFERL